MTEPPRRAVLSKASPLGGQRTHEVTSVGAGSLWLVRHALPLIDKGICYGQLDVQADLLETQKCAERLKNVLPAGAHLVSSPLQRCELLAHTLIDLQPGLTCIRDTRLQEMHFGQWEGRPWVDIDKTELAAWTDNFAHYQAGSASGAGTASSAGESVTQFMARVAAAFDELDPSRDTVWLTHAGVIRAATLLAQGIRQLSRADQWPLDAPAYGQWCKLAI